ncbi:MAG: hypothetical protein ABIL66_03840 [candidate division WOR-3 bacterium]
MKWQSLLCKNVPEGQGFLQEPMVLSEPEVSLAAFELVKLLDGEWLKIKQRFNYLTNYQLFVIQGQRVCPTFNTNYRKLLSSSSIIQSDFMPSASAAKFVIIM